MVLRLWFEGLTWEGPDSGVFASRDLLDNFFVLNRFQEEFKEVTSHTVIECHISDSERIEMLSDEQVLRQALASLSVYAPAFTLARLDADRSRLLRHRRVFSLFAPGDFAMTPRVTAADRPNLFLAGDWITSEQRSFFMERAAMTGIEAANAVLRSEGLLPREILTKPAPPALLRWMAAPVVLLSRIKAWLRRALFLEERLGRH
jgi:isorenieratene synthase